MYAYPVKDEHARDIMFELADVATASVPKEQGALKFEAEKTLHVLRNLFPPTDEVKFRPYFKELLGLCQYGLVGATAQPSQAMDTLRNLQNQIFDSEKGRAISVYMKTIIRSHGLWLLLLAAAFGFAFAVARQYFQVDAGLLPLPLIAVVPGLFVGLIFSSFIRCRTITFYDLHAIEADRFTPALKIAFALAIILLAAAFLKAELFEIKIGKAQLSQFDRDYLSAFVFGAVVGVAQEAIISRIESIKQRIAPSRGARTTRNANSSS